MRTIEPVTGLDSGEVKSIDAKLLREMFSFATEWLAKSESDINALNVFPVPDGDTGTNMLLTMRSCLEETNSAEQDLSNMVRAMAKGALMGARGNSGVILSQIWSGISRSLQGKEFASGRHLAEAFQSATITAYEALSNPVEGTMLTVIKEVADATSRYEPANNDGTLAVMDIAVEAARRSVANTPNLLPVLKESGVVDSGGQGLYIILEGALMYLKGQTARLESDKSSIINMNSESKSTARLFELKDEVPFGYCTEFILKGQALSPKCIEKRLANRGQSLIVVGDSSTLKIHIHCADPSPVIHYALSLGTISRVSIRNMDEQYQELLKSHEQQPATSTETAVVSVVSGEGFQDIFKKLGASAIVPGGQTMNPSAREILQAVENLQSDKIVILPNDKNLVLVAQQIKSLSSKDVYIIPTLTIPQGISALIAFNPQGEIQENVKLMEESRSMVSTIEVTRATRSTKVNGFTIRKNQAIGLLDGKLCAVGDNTGSVIGDIMKKIDLTESENAVIYYGADTDKIEAEKIKELINCQKESLDVQVLPGGQPLYQYIISVQ